MADQLVHLTDYDRTWPDLFADQQARVAAVLAHAAGIDPPPRDDLPE